jgi:hypothetical protein
MCLTKHTKPIALFAAILVLFAGLTSCGQALTDPAPEPQTPRLAGRVGNFIEEHLALIGQVPAGALAGLNTITGSPVVDYDFPDFLEGIWGQEYGDHFHLDDEDYIGYSVFGWPPSYGWAGPFVAVYYFDEDDPEWKGLVFAEFTPYTWCLTPSDTTNYPISAFYYQKIDDDVYYLMNLAKQLPAPDPNFPGYTYGQPMYATVAAAVNDLITQGNLNSMLLSWTSYARQ